MFSLFLIYSRLDWLFSQCRTFSARKHMKFSIRIFLVLLNQIFESFGPICRLTICFQCQVRYFFSYPFCHEQFFLIFYCLHKQIREVQSEDRKLWNKILVKIWESTMCTVHLHCLNKGALRFSISTHEKVYSKWSDFL